MTAPRGQAARRAFDSAERARPRGGLPVPTRRLASARRSSCGVSQRQRRRRSAGTRRRARLSVSANGGDRSAPLKRTRSCTGCSAAAILSSAVSRSCRDASNMCSHHNAWVRQLQRGCARSVVRVRAVRNWRAGQWVGRPLGREDGLEAAELGPTSTSGHRVGTASCGPHFARRVVTTRAVRNRPRGQWGWPGETRKMWSVAGRAAQETPTGGFP